MVKQAKPIDRHVNKFFLEARRFTPALPKKFKFTDLTAEQKDELPFSNHDLDHIALFHKNIRKNFWMYNADGQLNMEGARVLFRRKETNRQYINDPSTLNAKENDQRFRGISDYTLWYGNGDGPEKAINLIVVEAKARVPMISDGQASD
ncbi:hypothetical protein N7486_003349 [Penicillium sp. IBT 16267x]|nr:hypothetical protein N7486_003349 [Penicillium sp. IBT 16267x]